MVKILVSRSIPMVHHVTMGLINMSTNFSWDVFLHKIATLIKCQPDQLTFGSFEWHWLKPASSPWLPLQNKNGLLSLLKRVTTCRRGPYIIIQMDLLRVSIQEPALPWVMSGDLIDLLGDDTLSDGDTPVIKKVCMIFSFFF